MSKTIFYKQYDYESLYDLSRDIGEALDEEANPNMADIPKDKYGYLQGKFIVIIAWEEE